MKHLQYAVIYSVLFIISLILGWGSGVEVTAIIITYELSFFIIDRVELYFKKRSGRCWSCTSPGCHFKVEGTPVAVQKMIQQHLRTHNLGIIHTRSYDVE